MKVFVCRYQKFTLAIPSEYIQSIFIQSFKINNQVQYNSKNHITYISLPMLFKCPNVNIKHGIILKKDKFPSENKIILLSAKIENEKDIPEDFFYQLPKIMSITRFSHIFNGISFNASHIDRANDPAADIILQLDPEQLVQTIQKEIN